MKLFQPMSSAWRTVVMAVLVMVLSAPVQAAETLWGRDADVDANLADDGSWASQPLPATGYQPVFQALPALPVSAQPLPQNAAGFSPAAVREFESSLEDGRAEVFGFEGKARVMKKGTDYWTPVYKGMRLETGDKILTYEKSNVSVRYDRSYKNLINIKEKTQAEFRSIEPTEILLEKGTIYHYLDALVRSKNYRVTTQVGSFGVRGTSWVSSFVNSTGLAGTLQDSNNHESSIWCQFPNAKQKDPLIVEEGKQLEIPQGSVPGPGDIEDLDDAIQQEGEQTLQEFSQYDPSFEQLRNREEGEGGKLPPTSGDLGGVGILDAGGDGTVGLPENLLDPLLDTNGGNSEEEFSEPESFQDEPGDPEIPPDEGGGDYGCGDDCDV